MRKRLDEVADVTKLAGFEFTKYMKYIDDGDIIAIRALNLKGGRLVLDDVKKISKVVSEGLPRSQLHKYDIVLSYTGTIGETAQIMENEKYHLAPNVAKVIPNIDVIDPQYLFQYIRSKEFKQQMINYAHGSTQPTIPMATIRELTVPIYDLETERKIANVLTSIDNKIQTNTEINENLLQQAKTIFKSWFVDFAPFDEPMVEAPTGYQVPQSLRMVQIQDIPHILETGKRPKGGAVSEGIPSVGAENVKELGVFDASSAKYIPQDFALSMKKGKIEGYELLLYKDGGKPGTFIPHFSMFGEGFPYEEFYINEHVFKLDFNDRGYNEFAYLYMQTDYPYHWLANNGGKAAVPGINQQNVNEIWIYHPSHPLVQKFCKWVQPIFTIIFTNCAQNMKLSKLRDALLPKLISGELDVSSLDI